MANLTASQVSNSAPFRARISVDINIQAPIGGWNTRDGFDDIPQTDAIVMNNWIPGLGAVAVRKGANFVFESQAHGGGEKVRSLMVLESGNVLRLLGADDGLVYDVTQDSLLGSGFTNDYWSFANFDGKIIMVNGDDTPQEYDGSTFQDLAVPLVGPTTDPVGCMTFKNRMYYWERESQNFWYTALYAAGGTCTEYKLSRLTQFGGKVMDIKSWTHDGGNGPDDYIAFIMSSGEVIIYQGSSPSSAANWALVGVYNIGVPLGPRCATKFGGDVLIMTSLDIVYMSNIIKGTETLAKRSKISGAMEAIAELYGGDHFDSAIFPMGKLAIFNVPDPDTEIAQFAMNLITGAWTKLTGIRAYSWAVVGNEIFFGSDDGVVYEAFKNNYDEKYEDLGGGWQIERYAIQAQIQTAWLTFGAIGNKLFSAIKPIFRASAPVDYNFDVAVDFQPFGSVGYPATVFTGGTPWGSPWGSSWGTSLTVDEDWQIISGYGRYASMLTRTSTTVPVQWGTTIWLVEAGDRL